MQIYWFNLWYITLQEGDENQLLLNSFQSIIMLFFLSAVQQGPTQLQSDFSSLKRYKYLLCFDFSKSWTVPKSAAPKSAWRHWKKRIFQSFLNMGNFSFVNTSCFESNTIRTFCWQNIKCKLFLSSLKMNTRITPLDLQIICRSVDMLRTLWKSKFWHVIKSSKVTWLIKRVFTTETQLVTDKGFEK